MFECGGAHFHRDCNASKSTGKQSSGKGKQSKSWSKSEGKGKSKEIKGKSKGKSKGNKRYQRFAKGQNVENWSLTCGTLEIGGKLKHSGICTDMYH